MSKAKQLNEFQHTAARRRLLFDKVAQLPYVIVSTHSRAEAAAKKVLKIFEDNLVSTHSRAEAAALIFALKGCNSNVSTHSRAEAAAPQKIFPINRHISFNTQPRGGGCRTRDTGLYKFCGFNTQPRGGGCAFHAKNGY